MKRVDASTQHMYGVARWGTRRTNERAANVAPDRTAAAGAIGKPYVFDGGPSVIPGGAPILKRPRQA